MQLLRTLAGILFLVPGLALAVEPLEGDASRGEGLTAGCVACHGQDGVAPIDEYPHLSAQNERYLLTQMKAIRDGGRPIPLMAGQLDRMSDQDLADIAAFYAQQDPVIGQADPDEELLALGERIYRGGLMNKGVAACAGCHSPTGSGNAPAGFPRVSGLSVAYVVEQLRAYRENERQTDEPYGGMMRDVAHSLTDNEMKAVANYIKGLH